MNAKIADIIDFVQIEIGKLWTFVLFAIGIAAVTVVVIAGFSVIGDAIERRQAFEDQIRSLNDEAARAEHALVSVTLAYAPAYDGSAQALMNKVDRCWGELECLRRELPRASGEEVLREPLAILASGSIVEASNIDVTERRENGLMVHYSVQGLINDLLEGEIHTFTFLESIGVYIE